MKATEQSLHWKYYFHEMEVPFEMAEQKQNHQNYHYERSLAHSSETRHLRETVIHSLEQSFHCERILVKHFEIPHYFLEMVVRYYELRQSFHCDQNPVTNYRHFRERQDFHYEEMWESFEENFVAKDPYCQLILLG
jgi:hypothetical protein